MTTSVDDFDFSDTTILSDKVGFQEHCLLLNSEQTEFVSIFKEWCQEPTNRIVLVTGGPGTGKTFTVVETLKFVSCHVVKTAYTGRIAQRIGGKTIHSTMQLPWGPNSIMEKLEKELNNDKDIDTVIEKSEILLKVFKYKEQLPQILVIDEVSMVPFYLLYWIIKYFFSHAQSPVLVILIGDQTQLKPVKSLYNVFGTIDAFEKAFGHIRVVELHTSIRFDSDYARIIQELRKLVQKDTDPLFEFVRRHFPVVNGVDSDLLKKCHRALVHMNETANYYNEEYLENFPGIRVRLYRINFETREAYNKEFVDVKRNCDIFLTKNQRELTNGTPLKFIEYDSRKDELICQDVEKNQTVRVARDLMTGMFPIVLGFAGTIHKFQGDTIDDTNIVFNFNGCKIGNLVYTALSRVRNMQQILAVVL